MDSPPPAPIRYVHGNRLEALASRLAADLAAAPLADPLALETIVVPHPGMARWLERELARHWGVAAALEFPLPGRFVWRLTAGLAGVAVDPSPYEPERLALRILAVLPGLIADPAAGLPRSLARELAEPLAAWQFARRQAQRFDEYLVFRPEWLLAWEARRRTLPQAADEPWQAALWRRLRDGLAAPHRADLRRRALERLYGDVPIADGLLPPRLSVFGVPTIPPPALDLLAGLAGRVALNWYHLNPCASWWGELRSAREMAQLRATWNRLGRRDRSEEYETGHPLLAAWGAVGRQFLQVLHGHTGLSIQDEDAFEAADATSTLEWLQRGLLLLDPGHAPPPALEHAADSLCVHACAGALREVEVLHDTLLELLVREDPAAPHEIVVMTPDLARYAPLVDAVFGGAPESRRIPYTIADRAFAAEHGLAETVLSLLALPRGRLGAAQVLDWLRVPAIARRFGMAADGLAYAQHWVAQLGVHWGLDAGMRRAEGLGDYADGCWRPALDRLQLGAATGPIDGLVADTSPWADIEGGAVHAAGGLFRFVETLASWRTRLPAARSASAWADAARALIADCFDEDAATREEEAALAGVREALAAFADDAVAAGAGALALEHAAMLAELGERLQAPSARQRYPGTGITVCAMVPMRNVPFRVICLLGLDEARFPRRARDDGHDLLAADPRNGDRSLRDDDRYLFLEALLATRERLILTYTARNPRDGAIQEPSPLVQELLDFLLGAWPKAGAGRVLAALVRHHPATAYDPANFAQPSSASFAAEWLPAARASLQAPPVAPIMPRWPGIAAGQDNVPAESLLRFVRHPARDIARRTLGLAPEAALGPDEAEPFKLDAPGGFNLRARLVAALAGGADDIEALRRRARAEGLLPAGHAAGVGFESELGRAEAFVASWRDGPGMRDAIPATPVDLRVGPWRLQGTLPALDPRGVVVARPSHWHAAQWLELGLSAAVALGTGVSAEPAWAIEGPSDGPRCWRLDAARLPANWLEDLLRLWAEAGAHPVALWRRTSWEFVLHADGDLDTARDKARTRWVGGWHLDGESIEEETRVVARAFDEPLGPAFEELAGWLLRPLAELRKPGDD